MFPVPGPGRSSTKTPEICAEILERIANGETLSEICREERMPGRVTVYDWQSKDPDFSEQFARARLIGFDAIAEETKVISDTPVEGIIEKTDATGKTITREDMLGHRRLQVETRLKLLAKWDPKRYGDRQVVAGDPDAPLLGGLAESILAARARAGKSDQDKE